MISEYPSNSLWSVSFFVDSTTRTTEVDVLGRFVDRAIPRYCEGVLLWNHPF